MLVDTDHVDGRLLLAGVGRTKVGAEDAVLFQAVKGAAIATSGTA